MDRDSIFKVALSGLFTISSAASSEEQPSSNNEIIPPRPIEEICKATEEAEDGEGLDQDIIDFLNLLEKQGKVLNCDSAFEGGNANNTSNHDD